MKWKVCIIVIILVEISTTNFAADCNISGLKVKSNLLKNFNAVSFNHRENSMKEKPAHANSPKIICLTLIGIFHEKVPV